MIDLKKFYDCLNIIICFWAMFALLSVERMLKNNRKIYQDLDPGVEISNIQLLETLNIYYVV